MGNQPLAARQQHFLSSEAEFMPSKRKIENSETIVSDSLIKRKIGRPPKKKLKKISNKSRLRQIVQKYAFQTKTKIFLRKVKILRIVLQEKKVLILKTR